MNVRCKPALYLYSIFLSCLLLTAGVATVAVAYRPFKKGSVKIGAFLLLFIYGIVVYVRYYEVKEPCTFSISFSYLLVFIDNTLSVFFPSRGAYEELKEYSPVFQFHFYLFHLLTYIYGALILLSLFAGKMMNRFQQYYYGKKRCLFFGAGEPSKLLARDIIKNAPHTGCFFLVSEKQKDDRELFEQLDELGAIVFHVDFEDEKTNYARYKASRYFFLDEDQDFNVRMALQAVQSLPTKKGTETHLYIRTEMERIDNFFREDMPQTVEIHLFNQSDLTARCFVSEHPMLDCPEMKINHETLSVDYDFNLLLLGFGWAGWELLKKCICDAQFKGSRFEATVIDEALETKYGDYPVLYDECIREYNLNFIAETIGSKSFYEWITGHLESFNRIIVALGDDKTNMDIALTLARILQANGKSGQDVKDTVFAHVREKKNFGCYKKKDMFPVTVFGDMEEIYTENEIVRESADYVAKMVNYVYGQYKIPLVKAIDWKTAESEWSKASLFNKDSSRAVAQNMENIYRIARKTGLENPDREKLEILAENEHRRWNAFHFANGIRQWKLSDIPDDCEKGKLIDSNKNLLKHGCLVSFAELQAVSEKINLNRKNVGNPEEEDYQEVDRRIIRHFSLFTQMLNQKNNSKTNT
ncbi:MAG: hypothetical protein LBT76_06310 [Tannerella sp.]|nr:hypothetical protein [Tannerella sp.]